MSRDDLDRPQGVEPCPRDGSSCAVICGARAICADLAAARRNNRGDAIAAPEEESA